MSLTTFNLTDDHIKLIRNIRISDDFTLPTISNDLFGGDNIYDDINLILNGKMDNVNYNDPSNTGENIYSDEQVKEWDNILNELKTALSIVLYIGSFETGKYVKRYGCIDWIKI